VQSRVLLAAGKPICVGYGHKDRTVLVSIIHKQNVAGALSMFSVHSPDCVFTVLVSIVHKLYALQAGG